MKPRTRNIIIAVILIVIISTFAIIGVIISQFVKGITDPVEKERIAKTVISYELPNGYELVAAINLYFTKVIVFTRKNIDQFFVFVCLPEKNRTSHDEFINDISKAQNEGVVLRGDKQSFKNVKVQKIGEYTLSNDHKIPYALCVYDNREGDKLEGMIGMLNFANYDSSIFFIDTAKLGQYNYDLSIEFLNHIGPPVTDS